MKISGSGYGCALWHFPMSAVEFLAEAATPLSTAPHRQGQDPALLKVARRMAWRAMMPSRLGGGSFGSDAGGGCRLWG